MRLIFCAHWSRKEERGRAVLCLCPYRHESIWYCRNSKASKILSLSIFVILEPCQEFVCAR